MKWGVVGKGDIANTDHTLELNGRVRCATIRSSAFDLHLTVPKPKFEKDRAARPLPGGGIVGERCSTRALARSRHDPETHRPRRRSRADRHAHNQETPGEEAMFRSGDGEFRVLRRLTPLQRLETHRLFHRSPRPWCTLPTCNNLLLVQ